jgi:hypothetical protein
MVVAPSGNSLIAPRVRPSGDVCPATQNPRSHTSGFRERRYEEALNVAASWVRERTPSLA